jgi:hypothetical protein
MAVLSGKKPQEPRAALTMNVNSPRYGSCCSYCKGRVRVGRRFLVNPERSDQVFHVGCFQLKHRRGER